MVVTPPELTTLKSIDLIIPVYVVKGKKKPKKFYLNLNAYRNWKWHLSNSIKRDYKQLLSPILRNTIFPDPCEVTYEVFGATQRKFDVENICSITSKFFLDAAVEFGCIEDDNFTHIPRITYLYGGIEKNNPHIKVNIREILV